MSDPQHPVRPASPPPASQPPPSHPAAPSAPPVAPYSGPYAAPYLPPVHPQYASAVAPPARTSNALGIVAVIVAGVAAMTPIPAAVAAFRIGAGTGAQLVDRPPASDFDLSILTPVRDWVLLGELSFWIGTVLGVWALVQGIVAIVRNRGRIAGIVAAVIAVLAPIVFAVATVLALSAGMGAGVDTGV